MKTSRTLRLAAAISVLGAPLIALAQPAPAAPPKLVVVIVVDQLGANLFNQYRPAFGGGLKTLSQGLVYTNGYQSHAITTTCPGHATVLTGKRPNKTGIGSNSAFDRTTGKAVYCLAAPQNTLADGGPGENGRVGPDALLATTLGEWMKDRDPKTRVFAVSGKDRGAITLAGHKGDGAFWYVDGFGFTTYVEPGQDPALRLAPIAALNTRIKARFAARPATWAYKRKDCRKLEGDWVISEETWRSTVPPEKFDADISPLLDELTIEAAEVLLDGQRLGRGPATDVLGVSLSATDRVGHAYGTQGPEMCEQLHRLDAALGRFLRKLELIPGGVAVVLTADHGGSDFPERSRHHGDESADRSGSAHLVQTNAELRRRFSLDFDPIISGASGLIVVDAQRRGMAEPQRGEIARAAVELLRRAPTVAGAFTYEEVRAAPLPARGTSPEEYSLVQRYGFSAVDASRSPDIFVAFHPGITEGSAKVGGTLSSHGSPWDYDRRVPILFWRPGMQGQERFFPIETADIGPSLANLVGATPPADIDGKCLSLRELGAPACTADVVSSPQATK